MISYDTTVGAAQTQQIESYLALKYGITLDQTTPTDYLSSSSGIVYDVGDLVPTMTSSNTPA